MEIVKKTYSRLLIESDLSSILMVPENRGLNATQAFIPRVTLGLHEQA